MALWSGRFKKKTNPLVNEYTASIQFDHQLAPYDILGSLAHVKMLGKCGILKKKSVDLITEGLHSIKNQIQNNKIKFSIDDEDVHMNIEKILHQTIGEPAGQLHTGRSRNDQVALDIHLYLRHQIIKTVEKLQLFLSVLLKIAEDHIDTIIPGYTHLQRAEPIRFSHHMLAYFQMFNRDVERLQGSFARVNMCPLGAGALAGSGVDVDRDLVAKLLNFDTIYENSLDAVSDRDFIVEFLSNASLIMMHLSRLSEEIILWSSKEFSFIQLDDAFCTGSSMMPQKKNPDVAELARGKTGRVYGALVGLLTVLKGLPLAYNKDMQEDKEGLFDVIKTLHQTLETYAPMLESMQVNRVAMHEAVSNDFSNATQLANYLTSKKVPFRKAHEITGHIVLYCIDNELLLKDLPLKKYQNFHTDIGEDIYQHILVENVVESHRAKGGTAKEQVILQSKQAAAKLKKIKLWLAQHEKNLCN